MRRSRSYLYEAHPPPHRARRRRQGGRGAAAPLSSIPSHQAAYRDALFKGHACGAELQAFANQLTRYTLSDAAAMLTYVREAARGWLTTAPPEIRAEALSLVGEQIIAIRLRAGLNPFDDPLPGEDPDLFQLCKQELS